MSLLKLQHCGLPSEYNFKEFEADLKLSGLKLGLQKYEIVFLVELMGLTSLQDYKHGAICAVYYSVKELAVKMMISERTVNQRERSLSESWIVMTASRRSRRNGKRVQGRIEWAAGINLKPLIERAVEIRRCANSIRQSELEMDNCRAEILWLREKLIQKGYKEAADSIYARGRPTEIKIAEKLLEIRNSLLEVVRRKYPESVEHFIPDLAETGRRPNTSKNQDLKSCTEHPHKKINAELSFEFDRIRNIASKNHLSIWNIFLNTEDPIVGFQKASRCVFADWHGPEDVWRSACEKFGETLPALAVCIIDRNMQSDVKKSYFVKNPIGSFIGLMRAVENGSSNLYGMLAQIEKHVRHQNAS